ncbi:MAG: NADH:ubiquinone oxidoreductase [Armatimonadetes bacterium]|nr:NADH:ubiquinone oxidoreductase [Armatimonadota bacterium]
MPNGNGKPKVGFFSFASCEGCQLMVLECEEELLDLLGAIEIVNFREAMDKISDDYDIAFVEGSITTERDIEELKEIRAQAKILIALGACAWPGGLNMMKNFQDLTEVRKYVYGDKWAVHETIPARPIDAVVPVDYYVRGCPIDREEFLEVTKSLLLGKEPSIPNYPVCVECKLRENECRFLLGEICLGPIARAGCKAICPTFGTKCEGCRGLVDDPQINAQQEVLQEHGLSVKDILLEFRMFGGWYVGAGEPVGYPGLELAVGETEGQ